MRLACILLAAFVAAGCISYHCSSCERHDADAEARAGLEQRVADLEQDWVTLRDAIETLESAWSQIPQNYRFSTGTHGGIFENWPYSSKVSAVDRARNVVVLSVGKDDGVQPGFVFTVYRDDRYVGKVVVDDIREEHCTGYSPSELEAQPLQAGDDARVVWQISKRGVDGGEE